MLTVKNLTAGYNGKAVISPQSLQLARGEKCLINGISGSGKTTLLYALAGLGDVISGHVIVNDNELYALPPPKRDTFRGQNIGIIFQTLHLVKSLNVMDNVLLSSFAANRVQDTTRAEYLLERLGILHLKNKPVTAISQGQAQRVAIARALLCKPALLLADEPTSSLDDQSADNVMRLLSDLAAETNAALVVSSHDARIKHHFTRSLMIGETK